MDRDGPANGRFTDRGEQIYDFGDSFLVRCPRASAAHRDDVLAGIGRLCALLNRQE